MTLTPRLATATHGQRDRYTAAQYLPTPGECWYHVLYGHVPRHQMDTILRPVIPTQKLHPQHFAQLQPYIKLVMPPLDESFAFALCNLSCEDSQHQPGRGGLAMVVSNRVSGLRDHALRDSLVFAHAALAIDERFTPELLTEAALRLQQFVQEQGVPWYRSYYTGGQADSPESAQAYLRRLHALPRPEPDAIGTTWHVDAPPPHNLLLIECGDAPFEDIALCIARIGSVLYRTDLRWASISTGMEEIPRRVFDDAEYALSVRLLRGKRRLTQELITADSGVRLRLRTLDLAAIREQLADERFVADLFGLPAPSGSRAEVSLSPSRSALPVAPARDPGEDTRLIDSRMTLVSTPEPAARSAPAADKGVGAAASPAGDRAGDADPDRASARRSPLALPLTGLGGLVAGALGVLAVVGLRPPPAKSLEPPRPVRPEPAIAAEPAPVRAEVPATGAAAKPLTLPAPGVARKPPAQPAKDTTGDRLIAVVTAAERDIGATIQDNQHHFETSRFGIGTRGRRTAEEGARILQSMSEKQKSLRNALASWKQGTLSDKAIRRQILDPYCSLNQEMSELQQRRALILQANRDDEPAPPSKKGPAQGPVQGHRGPRK